MSGTHWAVIIGIAALAFAVYWFKFRRRRPMAVVSTPAGPVVVKKSGKKSWRSRLKSAAVGAALKGADMYSRGQASKALATASQLAG